MAAGYRETNEGLHIPFCLRTVSIYADTLRLPAFAAAHIARAARTMVGFAALGDIAGEWPARQLGECERSGQAALWTGRGSRSAAQQSGGRPVRWAPYARRCSKGTNPIRPRTVQGCSGVRWGKARAAPCCV